jgi:hypothetical protein
MRNTTVVAMSLLLCGVILMSGCLTPGKPTLNQTYLPNAQPDMPLKKIPLDADILKEIESKYVSLFWLSEDNILLDFGPKGLTGVWRETPLFGNNEKLRKSNSIRYVVIPSKNEIKRIEGAEEEAIIKSIDEKVKITTTDTKVSRGLQFFFSIGGGSRGEVYHGTIEDNGNSADIELYISEKTQKSSYSGGGGFFGAMSAFSAGFGAVSCDVAELNAAITNARNGNAIPVTMRWLCPLASGAGHKDRIDALLRKVSISPDGNFYFIGPFLYDSRQGKKSKPVFLFENYRELDQAINPSWTKIVVLRFQRLEKKKYEIWLEIFPLNTDMKIQQAAK